MFCGLCGHKKEPIARRFAGPPSHIKRNTKISEQAAQPSAPIDYIFAALVGHGVTMVRSGNLVM